jgi:hypothetical protein
MPNKKLLPSEQLINSIVDRETWKGLGIAAAMEGETKRNILEKAIKLYLETNHKDLVKGAVK